MAEPTAPTDAFDSDEFFAAFDALNEPATPAETSEELPTELDITDDLEDDTNESAEDEATDTEEPEEENTSEVYKVKVDGEEVEVSLDEALKGYMRRADHTRKSQEVATARKELDAARESFTNDVSQFQEQLGRLEQLDSAWDNDPAEVLTAFVLSTANPSQAIIEQVKAAAVAGRLDARLSKLFGVTDEVVSQLRGERESKASQAEARRAADEGNTAKAELEKIRQEQSVQTALSEYESQLNEIAETYKLDLSDRTERAAFRSKLSRFALDNEIPDLRKAYRLMRAEEQEAAEAAAASAKETTRAKARATNVAGKTRTGSGARQLPKANTEFRDGFDAAWDEMYG